MSEARTILAEAVTRILTDRVTKDVLESAEKGQWPAALWQALEESGLTLPLVPEARGGAGGSWGDAHVLLTAAGRFAAPVPLAETMIASWLLAEAGLEVPLGPLAVAPVRRGDLLRLERAGGGWRLGGSAGRVPWGGGAGHLVVVTTPDGRAGGEPAMIALVAAGQAQVTTDVNLALEPRDTLVFDGAPVLAAAPAPARIPGDVLWLYGALARAAQMAGGLEYLLAQTVQYAGERKQFGKPIGSFQAIQWQCAILGEQTAAAATAAAQAFRAAEQAAEAGEAAFEIAVAKSRVGEAAGLGAGIAHQLHGAIGFTYEHSLHFVTRRLWSWRAEFGGESHWAERLGREAASRGPDLLWPYLTRR
ncbi:MAG: acyl-CoA/acyl-ACP dehydrogenase [Candidatus Rokubacteria bacterium]|nr:acyl-CoA/acyl-ACP dehydrogenase [Candidatus Rokubacteria bacterium]